MSKLTSGKKALAILITVGFVLLAVGSWLLMILMFVWNITDIANVGVNFWNVFWLVLASLWLLADIIGRVTRKK